MQAQKKGKGKNSNANSLVFTLFGFNKDRKLYC